jgi:hypothetical protein
MRLLVTRGSSWSRNTVLASLVFGAFLLLSGAPAAKANGWEDCHRRISYTEMRYYQAIERFGPYSSAARHWAEERAEAFARLERYRRTHFRDGRDDDRDRDRR